jgi:hypothetical protein
MSKYVGYEHIIQLFNRVEEKEEKVLISKLIYKSNKFEKENFCYRKYTVRVI